MDVLKQKYQIKLTSFLNFFIETIEPFVEVFR